MVLGVVPRAVVRLLLPLLGGLMLVGCSSGIPRYDISVRLDESLRLPDGEFPSMDVDVIGDEPTENETWTGYPITRYFSGRDTARSNAPKTTMSFSSGDQAEQTLAKNAPIWKQWEQTKTDTLHVFAHLPGVYTDLYGEQDPRRVVIPLDRTRWEGGEIQIRINKTGASLQTPRRPAR